MAVYLIRHAHAGARDSSRHDRYRTLSEKGWRRAHTRVDVRSEVEITGILSSPATRCVQTVEPLATATGLEITEHGDLWEDASTNDVMALLDANIDGNVVMSSHGNLIPLMVEQLAARGVRVKGRGCEKGSIWVLDHDGREFTKATYVSKTVEMVLG